MFTTRSEELERIDTGDYTEQEYERFLKEIRWINRYVGDRRALRHSLLREISASSKRSLSVLDVGAGSGELLREISLFGAARKLNLKLVGIDSNPRSARAILRDSTAHERIFSVCGDAIELPFENDTFDYAISSLFAHHLTDRHIVQSLREMNRISQKGIYVIDLHRHRMAYRLYRIMCKVCRISELVAHDGSLSVLKGFQPDELTEYAENAGLKNVAVKRCFPFRLVLSCDSNPNA